MRDTDLRALRDKYERMLQLRHFHARAKDEIDFVEPDPRPAMAELARAFPGALREIDELPLEVIARRIEELMSAEQDPSRALSWMEAHVRFHALARGVLVAKRWLAGRPHTIAIDDAFTEALAKMSESDRIDAAPWSKELAAIAKPPRGRVMDLVYARLARELAIDVTSARAVVLPPRASLRSRRA